MQTKSLIALLAVSFLATASSAQTSDVDVITWNEDVKGWFLGVDQTIGNSCFMYASYQGGTFLRFQFNMQQDIMNFIVGNDNWKSLETGKLYELSVAFGRNSPWSGDAEARLLGGVPSLSLDIPFSEERAATFIEELRRTTGVSISYNNREIDSLELSGSFAAVYELIACQIEMKNGSANSDPFSGANSDPFE